MKAPKTITELKDIIVNLSHRERVCFPASVKLQSQIRDVYAVEVYSTELFDSKHGDTNINIKVVDILGKPITADNGKAIVNKSKYLRLFREDYFQSIFSIIQGDLQHDKSIGMDSKAISMQ